jgi:hypothetical protein
MKAQGTNLYNALRLWIHSILTAEKFTRGYRRKFISFDILIQNPATILETCLKLVELGTDPEKTASILDCYTEGRPEAFDQATAFIDRSLRRQRAVITEKDLSETGRTRDNRLINLADETYHAILSNLTNDEKISRTLDKLEPRILNALD